MRGCKASLTSIFISVCVLLSPALFARTQLTDAPIVSENFQIRVYSRHEEPQINKIQQWVLHLETRDGKAIEHADIRIRGGMPEHNHGFPTAPKVTEYLGQGDYLIEGMKFHMAGKWQIEFIVAANNQQDTLVLNFQL